MKSFKNSTAGKECSRLVLSSLGPVLVELGTTEIPQQSQLYPLNRRVDLTQDRRHCAQSLDLDLAERFHPILHHFNYLYPLLHLQTSLDLSLFIRWWICKTVQKKRLLSKYISSTAYRKKKLYSKLKTKQDVRKKKNSFVYSGIRIKSTLLDRGIRIKSTLRDRKKLLTLSKVDFIQFQGRKPKYY